MPNQNPRRLRHRWMISAIVVLLAGVIAVWQLAKSRSFQVAGALISHVETNAPVVALSFDDGPNAKALAKVLPILADRGVHATFFVTGAELARHPELGKELLAAGHELGNHSFSHRRMVFKSEAFIADEIERTDALIRQAGATGEILFRPPYGAKGITLPRYLARTGRRTIMWDVAPDSDSNTSASAQRMIKMANAEARPGSIILLHVMFPSRATSLEAVPGIIDTLQARGLRFVTVSELLQLQAAESSPHRLDD